jgi:deoxyadenosine/deoxycytidine kinase
MESKESMKSRYNIGDLVSHRYERPSRFGMVMKIYFTKSRTHEYSVSWLQENSRTRCTEGILEIIKVA